MQYSDNKMDQEPLGYTLCDLFPTSLLHSRIGNEESVEETFRVVLLFLINIREAFESFLQRDYPKVKYLINMISEDIVSLLLETQLLSFFFSAVYHPYDRIKKGRS